jgi:hypothetical protein
MLRNLATWLDPRRPRQRPVPVKVRVPAGAKPAKHYLGLCAIVRDEADYLAEWLEFHRLQGFEHIIIYDNGSSDETPALLSRYQDQGFVTVVPWAHFCGRFNAQTLAYAHAIANFGAAFRWLAFLDVDEFLFPVEGHDVSTVMRQFEHSPAVAVYWTMFGTSGLEIRHNRLTTETYTHQARYTQYPVPEHAINQKSIVNPYCVRAVQGAHLFHIEGHGHGAFLQNGKWLGKRNKDRLPGEPSGPLQLNHYFTRSREEFSIKMDKGRAPGPDFETRKRDQELLAWIDRDTAEDLAIQRFVPLLRERLGLAGSNNDADPQ